MSQIHQVREELVYTFRKNAREEVRAFLSMFEGHELVDLRVFARKSDGEWVPTRKGLTLDRALLPDLEVAVKALRASCDEESSSCP